MIVDLLDINSFCAGAKAPLKRFASADIAGERSIINVQTAMTKKVSFMRVISMPDSNMNLAEAQHARLESSRTLLQRSGGLNEVGPVLANLINRDIWRRAMYKTSFLLCGIVCIYLPQQDTCRAGGFMFDDYTADNQLQTNTQVAPKLSGSPNVSELPKDVRFIRCSYENRGDGLDPSRQGVHMHTNYAVDDVSLWKMQDNQVIHINNCSVQRQEISCGYIGSAGAKGYNYRMTINRMTGEFYERQDIPSGGFTSLGMCEITVDPRSIKPKF